jgi:hypothetical protein
LVTLIAALIPDASKHVFNKKRKLKEQNTPAYIWDKCFGAVVETSTHDLRKVRFQPPLILERKYSKKSNAI